tara:strand:- start:197 stop:304 length:108 start_codon:yes stop_codon:yes gene_type:complete
VDLVMAGILRNEYPGREIADEAPRDYLAYLTDLAI